MHCGLSTVPQTIAPKMLSVWDFLFPLVQKKRPIQLTVGQQQMSEKTYSRFILLYKRKRFDFPYQHRKLWNLLILTIKPTDESRFGSVMEQVTQKQTTQKEEHLSWTLFRIWAIWKFHRSRV